MCSTFCNCCFFCRIALLALVVIAVIGAGLLLSIHPDFAIDEDVVNFEEADAKEFALVVSSGNQSRANNMVDRLIQLMRSSALLSPQLNNITVEHKIKLRHGTIEDLNIQGLVAGMERSGDAVLSVWGTRLRLAMPISLRDVVVKALHHRESLLGSLQAVGAAHVESLSTRFRVSIGAKGMDLDSFKITSIGRIRMKQLDFVPGFDWLISWLGETQVNQRRAELKEPLEEAGTRVFQRALRAVSHDKVADFIAEKTSRLRMLG